MRALSLVLPIVCSSLLLAQSPLPHARVKVHLDDRTNTLERLSGLGIAADHGAHQPGRYLITDLSTEEIALAEQSGFAVDVLIEDVSAYYVARNAEARDSERGGAGLCSGIYYPTPQHFALGDMGGFLTWQQIQDELDEMAAAFPNLISPKVSIGLSVQGRPIHFVRISDSPSVDEDEPEVLYTALHHAREPVGAAQLLFFMWHLLESYGTDAEATYLIDHRELYFVPCINPDGYVWNETTDPLGGGMWRKNRRDNGDGTFGVDLNRNYGWEWGFDDSGSSPIGGSATYRGTAPFSEPEIQVMRDFCEAHAFRHALNNHSYGDLLVYPWGYVPSFYTPDSALYATHGQLTARRNGFLFGTSDQTVNYVVNGSSDDWMYGEQQTKDKIFAMTPETGNAYDGFWPQIDRIEPLCRDNVPQNLSVAHFAGACAHVTETAPPVLPTLNAHITFDVQRLGLDTATFTVSLTPLENVIGTAPPKVFTGMGMLEMRTDSIGLALDPAVVDGSPVRVVLSASNGLFAFHDTITKFYGTPTVVLADNGSDISNWAGGSWDTSTDVWFSPPASYTDSPLGDYSDFTDADMTLDDPIDLTGATSATLTFMALWNIEAELDYAQVSASTDGISWTPLCGRFTHPGSEFQVEGEPIYEGKQATWVAEEMSLNGFLGQNTRLRFHLVSNDVITRDGFQLDDHEGHHHRKGPTSINTSVDKPGLLAVHPSPADGWTVVHFAHRAAANDGMLMIHDPRGAIVRAIVIKGGEGRVILDTSDLSPGVYQISLFTEEIRTRSSKLVVVHR
ncbi:MAG: immune inhibitor A [Flavobacteriales bacterium]|nr:immune inhibitor A [Flavobacteriales bacterium]